MKVLIIRLLEACNAGCFMCGFAFSKDSYRFTVEDAHDLCNEIRGTGLKVVRFTGGEPLVLDDVAQIVFTFAQEDYKTSIITNGWYLFDKVELLRDAGLAQIIVSIDGSKPVTHDRYRRLPGLFHRCERGIAELKKQAPEIVTRVNTVVGSHNLGELSDLYSLLAEWGVDQWSIIPLKQANGAWKHTSIDELKDAYSIFQIRVESQAGPRLLGHSKYWAGRDEQEFNRFINTQQNITPRDLCRLVDVVRYYTPKEGLVYPCNCIPHRDGAVDFSETRTSSSWGDNGLVDARNWLRVHGPQSCKGCEPLNAALGEGRIDLDEDLFGF